MRLPSSFVSFPALRSRNFRLLWIGLLLSMIGSFMQNAALLWHVSLLVPPDKKGIALGMVGLVRVVPIVAFSLLSGVIADAWDRRRVMLATQSMAALIAITLAILAFRGIETVWPIYVLAALGGSTAAFDLPARQALTPMLVPREHLPNAISLNTILFQIAAVGGPALGGILIGAAQVGWTYALNALSYAFVIVALLAIRGVETRARTSLGENEKISLRFAVEGLGFVFRSPLIRSTMLLDFFATFFSSATALLPIYAQDILHVGARGYGALYAAPAVGALLTSAVMVVIIEKIVRRGPTLLWAVAAYGLATLIFGLSHSFWIAFVCLAFSGAADTVSMVIRNVVRQLETPDQLRGRMSGVNMVFFMGGPQLGELEAGLVANWKGAPFSVASGGIACLLVVAWIAAETPALRNYRTIVESPGPFAPVPQRR
ncbi:MAG TPA: MFS transporter [bacterium]|nr:MFS transporter [bacterium]